ncbi:hypothetical protein EYF80_004493 [Liparis tanakae]|uniref:Uncharacterized protein n=1 Tax=Liparis tanakae TaxID=230148 RepID=A0A4Z2J6G4_9TELE|nr:hypothetical protein EYF80_004493 [Liparis tanakae]
MATVKWGGQEEDRGEEEGKGWQKMMERENTELLYRIRFLSSTSTPAHSMPSGGKQRAAGRLAKKCFSTEESNGH